jgi:hypothetical protein
MRFVLADIAQALSLIASKAARGPRTKHVVNDSANRKARTDDFGYTKGGNEHSAREYPKNDYAG